MLQLKNHFYVLVLALLFYRSEEIFLEVIEKLHKSVIGLVKTSVPSFKKQPDRLSRPAALDALVFLKIFKMVLSETVARLNESI